MPRRAVHGAPRRCTCPPGWTPARSPTARTPRPPTRSRRASAAARERLARWLSGGIEHYADRHDRLAGGTSELSPYLHFGCLSARETEERARAKGGAGAAAFVRQLAWRDFYAHVLLHHPGNARGAYKRQFDRLEWEDDAGALEAWKTGRTGYPVVDAAMRQLLHQGWMHNRGRLIVGSFLTKDLHLDWRLGEAHFMRHLLCGDEAQNNGNWQWITSIGVDPAPYFRRLYNPMAQQERHDPDGTYVRRWCPELRDVPLARLGRAVDDGRGRAGGRRLRRSGATTRRRSSITRTSASGRSPGTAPSPADAVHPSGGGVRPPAAIASAPTTRGDARMRTRMLLAAGAAAAMAAGAAPAAAAPLTLDPAFGGGAGWVGTPFSDGAAPDYVKDATTTPDGRIVVVASGPSAANSAWALIWFA